VKNNFLSFNCLSKIILSNAFVFHPMSEGDTNFLWPAAPRGVVGARAGKILF
jgi:hypothetical protein